MADTLDIIDRLDGEEGFVRLVLASGDVVYGTPMGIEYAEDEDGWDTIKRLTFYPYHETDLKDYGLEDIVFYEPINEEDIPHM